jgi:CDP-glucose 4,6-dehydratase
MGLRESTVAGSVNGRLPDPAFWRGKRVFLTGHTGFKGAWLAIWLQRLGSHITGFALPPEAASLGEAAGVERRITSIRGDIRDMSVLAQAVRAANPHIVLHLAAQSLVRLSYQQPLETFATNVMGTAHVLEAARQAPRVQALVSVTTDKCYENQEWAWPYRENDRLGGHDPYSASKACAELVAAAWRTSFLSADRPGKPPMAVATGRSGNVIGGGDWSLDRLVPDCIRAFESGQTVLIRAPDATRPWQHVLEPLCGYLLLAEQLCTSGRDFAQAWNFGPIPDDVRPVSHVVRLAADAWGDTANWRLIEGPHPHEAGVLAVDSSLARGRLAWRPRLRLPEALEWTIRWHKQYLAGSDAGRLVEADVERYEGIGVAK